MCVEFGEVTVIIGLVINFLALVSLLFAFRDTSSYRVARQLKNQLFFYRYVLISSKSVCIIGERWEAIWIHDHVYACVLKVFLEL